MKLEAAALTHVGRRRSRNEDAYLFLPDRGLYAVADGMGGHAAGDVASQMAAERVMRDFTSQSPDGVAAGLTAAILAANSEIFERAGRETDKAGMGTTVTALALSGDGIGHIAHVGDSRAYRLRAGQLMQMTTDHTWVQEQVEAGRLTALQARHHPFASILTRALGTEPHIEVDLIQIGVLPGDMILLCSDGVTGMLDDEHLAAALSEPRKADGIAKKLVQAANRAGGLDNSTVIVLRASE
jgi:serine/threonine protein phosphatase PrpC